jgi:uncharacterized membrane protein
MKTQSIFMANNQADYDRRYRKLIVRRFFRELLYISIWVGMICGLVLWVSNW